MRHQNRHTLFSVILNRTRGATCILIPPGRPPYPAVFLSMQTLNQDWKQSHTKPESVNVNICSGRYGPILIRSNSLQTTRHDNTTIRKGQMTVKDGTHKQSYPGMTSAESVDSFYIREHLIDGAVDSGNYSWAEDFKNMSSEQLNHVIWTVEKLYEKANFHKFNRKWRFIKTYLGVVADLNDPPFHKIPMTEWTDDHWGRFFSIVDHEAVKNKASYF